MTALVWQSCLMLVLQVSMADGGSTKGFDMQKCWLNRLSSKIPVLVVAVDDPLLTCADRILQHWRRPGASNNHPLTLGEMPSSFCHQSLLLKAAASQQSGYSGLYSSDPCCHPDREIVASSRMNSFLMMTGDTQCLAGQKAMGSPPMVVQALHTLLVEAEARTACALRLLVQSLSVGPVHLLVDVHAAGGSRPIPITVDTHRWGPDMPSSSSAQKSCIHALSTVKL